ncbi:glycerophosphodiester phosphodiesterase [Microbispora sp. NPDC049125]|uniref:glycerophosphodiester phosphodiesterase n=1 Tax=Microbispora sp. NPDC049125 TaxID=3154929 RepID=UPI003464F806
MRRVIWWAAVSLPTLALIGGGGGLAPSSEVKACSAPGVVAHRGDRSGGTENTAGAFQAALDAGADQVELDVHFTKDHQPVLMHDATVDRTTTGTGAVSGMTLSRFRALRTTDGGRPPTLAGVLDLVREAGARVLVELKQVPDAGDLESLRRTYRSRDAYGWASMMSFSPQALRAVRSIPASQGLLSTSAPPVSAARRYDFVGVRHDALSRARVRAYRDAGVAVYAWTPNDPASWRRLAGYGVNRVVTDRPYAYLAWAGATCGD